MANKILYELLRGSYELDVVAHIPEPERLRRVMDLG